MTRAIPFVILALATLGVARAAYSLWRQGAFEPFKIRWRGASWLMRGLVLALVLTAVAYGSDKILGGHIGEGMRTLGGAVASLCTNVFTFAERQTGYAASAVRTNETHDLAMPAEAQMAERIARRGAHNDGFWFFDAYTNRLAHDGLDLGNPVWVHTDGTLTVRSPAPGLPIQELAQTAAYSNITVYAPLQSSYGFLPANKWPDFMPSLIWTAITDRGSRVVTWEGARLNRDVSQPVSFQAEFHESGEVTYRYDTFPTNGVATGVFRNGTALAFNPTDPQSFRDFLGFQDLPEYATLQPFNISTLQLSYIGDLGDGSGDTDEDGLTDWEEVKRHHTDPRKTDTDGDGLADGYEVQNGTDPLNPDTDCDGIPDGQIPSEWHDNPLWANSTNANFTVRIEGASASDRVVVNVDGFAFFLEGTNAASIHLAEGVAYDVGYVSSDGRAHSLEAVFADLAPVGPPLRGAEAEEYRWYVDDPDGVLSGGRRARGGLTVAIVSLRLVARESPCVHAGDGCVFDVTMSPDIWRRVKDDADLDVLVLQDDGSLFLPVPDEPGAYADGTLVLGHPHFREGGILRHATAHRCTGWYGEVCPICGTIHDDDNHCDHDPGCGAGHSPPDSCTCAPIQVPLNCDDDDDDGTEDRHQAALATDEDDLVSFSPIRAHGGQCCCDEVSYSVRITGVSGNLRLWDGDSQIGTGGVSDGGSLRVEGVATNAANETSHISYAVLDKDGETITTITRKFVVTQSVSFVFDPGSVAADGAVVVVKRSTDPVRINNSSFSVETAGIAAGAYRLVSDKTKFHLNNMTSLAASLPSGSSGNFEIYGDTPSSSMFDAELSLKTVEGTTLCTTNITVLWVEISMRCGQDDPFSADNGRMAFPNNTLSLGKQVYLPQYVITNGMSALTAGGIGNVVEIVGAVHPADFSDNVSFARDSIDEYVAAFTSSGLLIETISSIHGNTRGPEPFGNDPTFAEFQDRDPHPNGKVFDIDTPGFPLIYVSRYSLGTLIAVRYNFLQYANFSGRRCSDDFAWHSKTTIRREESAGIPCFNFFTRPSFPDDNSCGSGHSTTAP